MEAIIGNYKTIIHINHQLQYDTYNQDQAVARIRWIKTSC